MTIESKRLEELVARLRAEEFSGQYRMGGGSFGTDGDGKTTSSSWGGEKIMRPRNPDGHTAAALIETLRADKAKMLEAVEDPIDRLDAVARWLELNISTENIMAITADMREQITAINDSLKGSE